MGSSMPSTKNYRQLHNRIVATPGAAERLAGLRKETLAEVRLSKFRGVLRRLSMVRRTP